jgi:hypothetical protein
MPNDRCPVILIAICAAVFLVGPLTEVVAQNKNQNDSALGEGHGIDHVGILVRDLEGAKDTYRDTLGFWIQPRGVVNLVPSGMKINVASFEDGSYLSLNSVNDLEKVRLNRHSYLTFLEKHEGAKFLVLDVSSAEGTARFLRARGLEVSDPDPRTVTAPGAKEMPPPTLWAVTFKKPVLPADSISFVQYAARDERIRQANAAGRTHHANTAKRIAAVWIVVRDLKAARKAFGLAGLDAGEERKFPALGAAGREIEAGGGRIVLLVPKDNAGKAASFLAERDEGIMGVSIEVGSLEIARALLEKNTKRDFVSYAGTYGNSILIPAELAHGVWIEMFQKAR